MRVCLFFDFWFPAEEENKKKDTTHRRCFFNEKIIPKESKTCNFDAEIQPVLAVYTPVN